ncbi:RHS repeat-associated core domain-containing protein [Burkholderia multivorans]|nr:RHS repeat-associated core domain-containing protein [Burkholderia multivorans]MCO1454915.1 RHS repeat-associated core domain-containing protein [Burkholderia multivorans]MCO1469468.1 RHS repeat-associated core domain-containing protein [Burkholderia multivorans]
MRNPLRFQGQYFDHETGLHCNRHRYYDPGSGRFVSKDPIGLAGFEIMPARPMAEDDHKGALGKVKTK